MNVDENKTLFTQRIMIENAADFPELAIFDRENGKCIICGRDWFNCPGAHTLTERLARAVEIQAQ